MHRRERGDAQSSRFEKLGRNKGPTTADASWSLPPRFHSCHRHADEMTVFFLGFVLRFPVRHKQMSVSLIAGGA